MKTETLQLLNAINNISIKKVEGQSLTGFYVSGTSFAKDYARKILDQSGIKYSVMTSGTISFAINKN